jgi:hypothetical protein
MRLFCTIAVKTEPDGVTQLTEAVMQCGIGYLQKQFFIRISTRQPTPSPEDGILRIIKWLQKRI